MARITVSAGWAAISSCVKKGIQPQGDAQLGELAFIPLHQVKDLRPARLLPGQPELPADLRQSFNDFNAVPTFGGGAGGLQPGRTGADDQQHCGAWRRA